jgi:hypothetical protein
LARPTAICGAAPERISRRNSRDSALKSSRSPALNPMPARGESIARGGASVPICRADFQAARPAGGLECDSIRSTSFRREGLTASGAAPGG